MVSAVLEKLNKNKRMKIFFDYIFYKYYWFQVEVGNTDRAVFFIYFINVFYFFSLYFCLHHFFSRIIKLVIIITVFAFLLINVIWIFKMLQNQGKI